MLILLVDCSTNDEAKAGWHFPPSLHFSTVAMSGQTAIFPHNNWNVCVCVCVCVWEGGGVKKTHWSLFALVLSFAAPKEEEEMGEMAGKCVFWGGNYRKGLSQPIEEREGGGGEIAFLQNKVNPTNPEGGCQKGGLQKGQWPERHREINVSAWRKRRLLRRFAKAFGTREGATCKWQKRHLPDRLRGPLQFLANEWGWPSLLTKAHRLCPQNEQNVHKKHKNALG